jgi:hypothetical protein
LRNPVLGIPFHYDNNNTLVHSIAATVRVPLSFIGRGERETAILRMRCHKNGRGIRSVPDKEVKKENLDLNLIHDCDKKGFGESKGNLKKA